MAIPTEHDALRSPDEASGCSVSDGVEEVTACPLCRSQQLELLFTAHDTLHSMPGEWGVHSCRDCGLMLTSPRPNPVTMPGYYPKDYQPFGAPHAPTEHRPATAALKRLARRLLDPMEHVLPRGLASDLVLEVGCGSGRYLAQLAASGWQVQGLEPSAETADRLREATGLPVFTGSISEAGFASGSFDLVVAVMVLEHLHAPLEDLGRMRAWLRPGGYITGSVPNAASWEFRYFEQDWYALQVPTHLFHFTPTTLTRLLEKAGFEEVRIYHQRNVNNLMIHMGRFLQRHRMPGARICLEYPEKGPAPFRYALRPVSAVLAWIGQAGRISFTARKGKIR